MTVPLARSCCQTLRPLGTGIRHPVAKPRTLPVRRSTEGRKSGFLHQEHHHAARP